MLEKVSSFHEFFSLSGKEEEEEHVTDSPKPAAKKAKLEISDDIMAKIKEDEANKKQWEDVLEEAKSGKVRTSYGMNQEKKQTKNNKQTNNS